MDKNMATLFLTLVLLLSMDWRFLKDATGYTAESKGKVARIVEREEERHKWRAYYRIVQKYHTNMQKGSSSRAGRDRHPSVGCF